MIHPLLDLNGLSDKELFNLLNQIGNQAYVRGKTKDGYFHSVFIVGFSSTDVVIYDANYTGRCQVSNVSLDYSEFRKRIAKLDSYYTKDGDLIDM